MTSFLSSYPLNQPSAADYDDYIIKNTSSSSSAAHKIDIEIPPSEVLSAQHETIDHTKTKAICILYNFEKLFGYISNVY